MRNLLVLAFIAFAAATANADSAKSDRAAEHAQTYTARADKLDTALRTRSHHALSTLPQGVLDQLKAGQTFTLAKTDERAKNEDECAYALMIGTEREEISAAVYEALREISQRR